MKFTKFIILCVLVAAVLAFSDGNSDGNSNPSRIGGGSSSGDGSSHVDGSTDSSSIDDGRRRASFVARIEKIRRKIKQKQNSNQNHHILHL